MFMADKMLLCKFFSSEFLLGKLDYGWYIIRRLQLRKWCHSKKMVPFYGTVYKSILYDLIIPFPACESGAEREK